MTDNELERINSIKQRQNSQDDKLKKMIVEMRLFVDVQNEYLKQCQVDKDELENISAKAKELINEIELVNKDQILFNDEKIESIGRGNILIATKFIRKH